MKAQDHTLSMIDWWKHAGVRCADLAVRRADGAMLWHRDLRLDNLPLPWARAENARRAEVYIRPARGYPWPLVFLDDVAEEFAVRVARKYEALVVRTSKEGGCHLWLACTCTLGERDRHLAQCWLASRADADVASTSGEHLGRLAGFKNWKRNGAWVNPAGWVVGGRGGGGGTGSGGWVVNVVAATLRQRRWVPRAGDDVPLPVAGAELSTPTKATSCTDASPSGVEWGWVCGMLEAGLPPHQAYYRLVERARRRRGSDSERYARHTVAKALARTRHAALRM